MRKIIPALVLFLSPFWAFSEETTFTLCEGVSGAYSVSKDGKISVVITQQQDANWVNTLSVFYSTGHVSFTLCHQPASGFGKFNNLEVAQEHMQIPTGAWHEYFVFEDKRCLGPPARMTPVKNTELLNGANWLAHKIGEFFLSDKKKEPKDIEAAIFEALAFPAEPAKPGEFRVSPQISGRWSSQLTRDGVLEALSFDNNQLSWSIRHSTWNRGPAMNKSGLWIHLNWKNKECGQTAYLHVSKIKGHIRVDSSSGGLKITNRAYGLVVVSESLLTHFREQGCKDELPKNCKDKITGVMAVPFESYLTD